MPCKEWTKSIKGVDDIELEIPRASPLVYHCAAPESGEAKGLVFIIPGLGEDAGEGYQRRLRAYLAEEYRLLAVTVEYHCYRSRPATGAVPIFTPMQYTNLRELCVRYGILITSPADINDALGKLPLPYRFDLRLLPPNGDYQNFGVMSALDHLCVLADLRKAPDIAFDLENLVAFGSSHGAYIAHLIAKFAPNTLRAVIDNSAYTAPPVIGVSDGKVIFGPSAFEIHNLARMDFYVDTAWTSGDPTLLSCYSDGRHAIRDVACLSHIQTAKNASHRSCQFRMIHSIHDDLLPIENKRQQAEFLRTAGFDVQLKEVTAADVDGKMIKSTAHGLDASLRFLFDYFYPTLQHSPGKSDADSGVDVGYMCGEFLYSFGHGSWGCRMHVENMGVSHSIY